jgi:3-hydroxybutyryl-CoA dehydrogenase
LFEAVRLIESSGMDAADVDDCMRLGAGHPMGPLRLLDFVGLDVAVAIGESLHADSGRQSDDVPDRLRELVAEGRLGRKSGAGFYSYDG